MKKIIFVLLITALTTALFNSEIRAADTTKVKLTLNKNMISSSIESAKVKTGDFIIFYTEGSQTFKVTIMNDNNFFNIDTKMILFSVQRGKAHMYEVGKPDPGSEAKISPFDVIEPADIEIVPTAPPRIVLVEKPD